MSSDTSTAAAARASSGTEGHPLIGRVGKQLCEGMHISLEGMFSACDDHLFDLASRARSNQEQNRLFENLRQIRQHKIAVIEAVAAQLQGSVDAIGRKQPAVAPKPDATAHYAENLQLIGEDQIEKDVMIADMIARARAEWQQELFQLHERLQALAPRRLEEFESPFDPENLARAFTAAAEGIGVELDLLKLVYRQFDRHVLGDLEDTLLKANQTLIDAGILPELPPLWRRAPKKRDAAGKRPDAVAPTQPAATAPPAPAPTEQEYFGIPNAEPEMRELAHLLQRMRAEGIRLPMFPASSPDATLPPIPREELVTLLSDAQQQKHEQAGAPDSPLDIREAISSIIAARGALKLGQADEDTINVVAMFFDLLLDDRTLPIEIQALVSRLQIPILKVALRDRSFFSDRKHPARMLLNEIARTSIGWESSGQEAQDALFRELAGLVDEILRSSADNTDVFSRCLEDLSRFNDKFERRTAKIEKRISEKASAEARTVKARDMVRHVLHEQLDGKQLPPGISDFLISDWQPVMQRVYLRHGKDSAEWLEAVQTVADLVWSAQPHEDAKSKARLERLAPELHERILKGLEQIQSHGDEVAARAEVVRSIHESLAESDPAREPVVIEPLTPDQLEQITPSDLASNRSWTEMTAVERQQVQFEALTYEYLKRVDDMPLGTWLQYDDLSRGTVRRCKLAARVEEIGEMVFVNRLGLKVMAKPRKAFAYDLQMGHAKLLETAPLFERTIGRIAANLKGLAGEAG